MEKWKLILHATLEKKWQTWFYPERKSQVVERETDLESSFKFQFRGLLAWQFFGQIT